MTLGDRIVVMKDGVIQQADTPLKTYNEPANRFVAGFIGMPPMNFFDGMIRKEGDGMSFVEGDPKASGLTMPDKGFTIDLPPILYDRLDGWAGKHVVLGIRPEHLHVRPTEMSAAINVRLNVIEPLGNDMDVYASTTLHDQLVARLEAQSGLQVDSQMTLYADLRKIHVFAPGDTGLNLSQSSEPAHAHA
jgi:multiple sugar transport system ATP-binding protein